MLVHYIGGPAHGRTEAVQNALATYHVAAARRMQCSSIPEEEMGSLPRMQAYDEHHYRVTKRTPRYVIAEWEAPQIQVRFEVEIEIEPFDTAGTELFRRFIYERHLPERGDVKCVAAEAYNAEKLSLTLATLVEGPEDPIALQLGAEKVQHYLDSHFPAAKQRIQRAVATTGA